jgi:hypothetical protein
MYRGFFNRETDTMQVSITKYILEDFLNILKRSEKRAERRGIPFEFRASDPVAQTLPSGEVEYKTTFDISDDWFSEWAILGHKSIDDTQTVLVFGSDIPMEHRTETMHCDHCNTNRRRHKVFILKNKVTDAHMQVGSTCIDAFVGAPKGTAELYSDLAEEIDAFQSRDCGHVALHYDIEAYMAVAAMAIREYGFVKNDPYMDGVSTKESVNSYFYDLHKGYNGPQPTQADKDMASAVIAWGRNLPQVSNDYMFNLASVLGGDTISPKCSGGIACSAVPAYLRATRTVDDGLQSKFMGALGDRIEFECTVTRATEMDTDFGTSTLYVLRDGQGNMYKWFATGCGHMSVADKVRIKGTVKKHEEYKGVEQTVLSRCKVTILA